MTLLPQELPILHPLGSILYSRVITSTSFKTKYEYLIHICPSNFIHIPQQKIQLIFSIKCNYCRNENSMTNFSFKTRNMSLIMNWDRIFKTRRVSYFQRQCILFCTYLYIKVVLPQGQGNRVDAMVPSKFCLLFAGAQGPRNAKAAPPCFSSQTRISFQLRLPFLFFHAPLCIPDVAVQYFSKQVQEIH